MTRSREKSDLPKMSGLPENEKLVPTREIIRLASERGISLGRGDPNNTIRYYTKIGLLPHAQRKLAAPDSPATEGHYPISVLERLRKISLYQKTGLSAEQIKKKLEEDSLASLPQAELRGSLPSKPRYSKTYKFISAALALVVTLTASSVLAAGLPNETFQNFKENIASYFEDFSYNLLAKVDPKLAQNFEPSKKEVSFLAQALQDPKLLSSLPAEFKQNLSQVLGFSTSTSSVQAPLLDQQSNLTVLGTTTTQKLEVAKAVTLAPEATLSGGQIDSAGQNLIQNSSFEANKLNQPEYWQLIGNSHGINTFSTDSVYHSGSMSLKLYDQEATKLKNSWLWLGVKQEQTKTSAGRDYILSLYLRPVNLNPDAVIRIGLTNSEKEIDLSTNYNASDLANETWTRIFHRVESAKKDKYPQIELLNYKKGVLYFDDVQLEEGSTATAYQPTGILKPDGTVSADSSGSIYPTKDNRGLLGLANNRFEKLWIGGIDANGNFSLDGKATLSQNVELGSGSSNTLTAKGRWESDLMPTATNTYNLGSSTLHWNQGYFNNFEITDSLLVKKGLSVEGSITATSVNAAGNITPSANATYDLGSSSLKWQNLYLSGNITAATSTNTINGLIVNAGALSGITTLSMSGALSGATTISSTTSVNSPIFYDSNNTVYYADFANTTTSLIAAGNVGIGTTSPTGLLSVGSSSQFSVNSSGIITTASVNSTSVVDASIANADLANSSVTVTAGTNLSAGGAVALGSSVTLNVVGNPSFATSVASPVYYDSSGTTYLLDLSNTGNSLIAAGNVGIGTTSPTGLLSVGSSSQFSVNSSGIITTASVNSTSVVDASIAGGDLSSSITINTTGSVNAGLFYDSGNTAYYLDPANTTTSLLAAGNVGIGTTGPTEKLQVAGSVLATGENANYHTSAGALDFSGGNTRIISFGLNDSTAGGIFFNTVSSAGTINTNPMVISTAGNVGIGTTGPTVKLDTAGRARFQSSTETPTGSVDAVEVAYYSAGGYGEVLAYNRGTSTYKPLQVEGSYVQLRSSGTDVMRITGGNVGIGTTTPGYKLDVQYDTVADVARFKGAAGDGIILTYNQDGGGWFPTGTGGGIVKTIGNTGNNGALGFSVLNSGSEVKAMVITNTGNVGIGTTGPGELLQVHSGTNTTGTYLKVTEGAYGAYLGSTTTGHTGAFVGQAKYNFSTLQAVPDYTYPSGIMFGGRTGYGNISFFSDTGKTSGVAYTPTEVMTIRSSGNVGIGTTNPGQKLDVIGSAYVQNIIYLGKAGLEKHFIIRSNAAGTDKTAWAISLRTDQGGDLDDFRIDRYDADGAWTDNPFRIANSTGNVGIGTTGPSYRLHVTDTTDTDNPIIYASGPSSVAVGLMNLIVGVDASRGGLFLQRSGDSRYLWVDDSGNFRIKLDAPAGNAEGTVVGTQTSSLDTKNVSGQFTDYAGALNTILNTNLYNFTYKSGSFNNQEFTGIISDYSPIFGMDRDATHPAGKSFNPVTAFGYTVAAIKELDSRTKGIGTSEQGNVIINGNVGIGTTGPDSKVQISGGGLCVGSDANCNTDNNTEGYVYAAQTAMIVYDVAENYPTKDNTLEAAEAVTLDESNSVFVKRSSSAYDSKLIGIISTEPAVLLGGFKTEKTQFPDEIQVPVALSGRVPVKVSTENGPIAIGDALTSSSQPGVAMKATKAGLTVGKALESYNGEGIGKILVFVNVSYADPQDILANLTLDKDGVLSIPNLKTGKLLAQELTDITSEVAGVKERLTKLEEATSSATLSTSEESPSSPPSEEASTSAQIATSSADYLNIASMSASFGEFKDSLKSLGVASLGMTTVAGRLSQDATLYIDNGNEISVIDPTALTAQTSGTGGILYLQKSPLSGGLDILAGKVTIDKNGNITVTGEVRAAKVVAGDIEATGSARLAKLEITTDAEQTASATIGSGTLVVGQTQVTINTNQVTAKSKIFVTATTPTGGQMLYVAEKVAGASFTVAVEKTHTADIKFDWWIVN